jgi:hypothetical protein
MEKLLECWILKGIAEEDELRIKTVVFVIGGLWIF